MALIRSAQAGPMVRDAVVLDLGDLQRQGAELVARARQEADRIVQQARLEREQILAGAAEEGRAQGLATGTAEGRRIGAEQARGEALAGCQQELERLQSAWLEALRAFCAQRDGFVQAAERDVIRLAVKVAGKIVKRAIELEPEIVVEQVRAVLATVIRPTEAVIAVHPQDMALVQRSLGALLAEMPSVKGAEIVEDARLPQGSCVARMRDPEDAGLGGEVDASVSTQLDRVVSVLLPGARPGELSY